MGAGRGLLVHAIAALAILGSVHSAAAQVTLDGTANPAFKGPLVGPDYQIGAELGRRAGSNLFHSFERFDLRAGESATFSGPPAIRNVITRVTGGQRSDIDGTLRSTIPGADLYFLNPAGIVFGPDARLDLQGSLHISTADELRFAGGARFSAATPAASSFTVAAPVAFGFLGAAPSAITVDRSVLEVPARRSFSLVGGDLAIQGDPDAKPLSGPGTVRAEAGRIMLTAMSGPGEAPLAGGDPGAVAAGDILLKDRGLVDASGNGGGSIRIRSGRFLASNLSFVVADNTGSSDAANGATVKAKAVKIDSGAVTAGALGAGDAGNIVITADEVTVENTGIIDSSTDGTGDAGRILIAADKLTVRGNGFISSGISTFPDLPSGEAGMVVVVANDVTVRDSGGISAGRVVVTADALTVQGFNSSISSDTTTERDAGGVTVTGGRVMISDFGEISSDSDGEGDAGQVVVRAHDLTVSSGFISSRAGKGHGGAVMVTADNLTVNGGFGGINSATANEGDAGRVVVKAGQLMMGGAGKITSDSFGGAEGDAGTVVVRADRLMMRGGSKISSEADEHNAGDAGEVTVTAKDLDVRDARISSAALNRGTAGRVTVSADRFLLDRGAIRTNSGSAGGGEIRVMVKDLIDLRNSAVTASVAAGADPTAGNILIDAQVLVIDHSTIQAAAGTGAGGNVEVVADNILVPGGDLEGLLARGAISASGATQAVNGTVTVRAPEIDLSGGLVVLATGLLDASSQLRQRCATRRDVGASSFTGVGRGGLPPSPDAPLLSDYALQEKPAAGSVGETGDRDESKAAPGAVTLVLPCRGPA